MSKNIWVILAIVALPSGAWAQSVGECSLGEAGTEPVPTASEIERLTRAHRDVCRVDALERLGAAGFDDHFTELQRLAMQMLPRTEEAYRRLDGMITSRRAEIDRLVAEYGEASKRYHERANHLQDTISPEVLNAVFDSDPELIARSRLYRDALGRIEALEAVLAREIGAESSTPAGISVYGTVSGLATPDFAYWDAWAAINTDGVNHHELLTPPQTFFTVRVTHRADGSVTRAITGGSSGLHQLPLDRAAVAFGFYERLAWADGDRPSEACQELLTVEDFAALPASEPAAPPITASTSHLRVDAPPIETVLTGGGRDSFISHGAGAAEVEP